MRSLKKGALQITARCLAGVGILTAAIALSATPAMALGVSNHVALIPSSQPNPPAGISPNFPDAILPTTSDVAGDPSESFAKFSFTNVALSQINSSELSQFDTVVLNQVRISALSPTAKSVLAGFVSGGGKLLIHDADGTGSNDYSWLLSGQGNTQVGAGCNVGANPTCGKTSGSATILANSTLISANPADASYVNISDMGTYTDAIGDSNLLTSTQGWLAAVRGENALTEQGSQLAYGTRGSGLVVYNGFDTDMIMPTGDSPNPKSTTGSPWRCVNSSNTQFFCPNTPASPHASRDWLAQMYYNELSLAGTPVTAPGQTPTPVSTIGTPVPPTVAGLPPANACVAKQSVRLQLLNLVRHHHNLVRIDVYVNGRHRLKESVRFVHVKIHGHRRLVKRGRFHNATLRNLPQTGAVVLKVIGTTSRHYHLISKQTYQAC